MSDNKIESEIKETTKRLMDFLKDTEQDEKGWEYLDPYTKKWIPIEKEAN